MKRITNYITALLTIIIILVVATIPSQAVSTPYQCRQYLSNADKSIKAASQNSVTHQFRRTYTSMAMMYMDRYKICKDNLPVKRNANDLKRLLDRAYNN